MAGFRKKASKCNFPFSGLIEPKSSMHLSIRRLRSIDVDDVLEEFHEAVHVIFQAVSGLVQRAELLRYVEVETKWYITFG